MKKLVITFISDDRPGLVEAAPMSSQPLFKADLAIGIPAAVNLEELSEKLDAISQSLDIECMLKVDE